jgi:serine/threonine protein kinase
MNSEDILKGHLASYVIDNSRPFAYGRISVFFKGSDQHGQSVCIKVFREPPQTPRAKKLLKEFLREVTAQMALKHPYILPIVDFGTGTSEDAAPFLVLPLCEEGDLRMFLKSRSFIPLDEALPILQQVAYGLDHAHKAGFIHGDIKPENILLTDGGSHCYLADFGMSKYFQIVERVSISVDPGDIGGGGSASYLSPEQIDEGRQSPSSDIYSFAIVAYELLTGALPFDVSVTPFRQMRDKIEGRVIDPLRINTSLPQTARDGLLRGLSLNSKDRPSTAFEFCHMLANDVSTRRFSSDTDHPIVPIADSPIDRRSTVAEKKNNRRISQFWQSLEPATKVAAITAVIAAIAAIITALIKIIPELKK